MRIIGHRGARNLWPENSLGGFRTRPRPRRRCGRARPASVSSDGEVVVIHDPLLERTTDGRGPVAGPRLEALRACGCATSIAETIPTLAQMLDVFAPTGLDLELEMKTDARGLPYPGLVEKAAALVEARGMAGPDRRLTCFVPEVLGQMRAAAPRLSALASLDRRSGEMFGGVERAIRALRRSRLHHRRRAPLARTRVRALHR